MTNEQKLAVRHSLALCESNGFTRHETKVVFYLMRNYTYPEIAEKIGCNKSGKPMTEKMARNHLKEVMRKLNRDQQQGKHYVYTDLDVFRKLQMFKF